MNYLIKIKCIILTSQKDNENKYKHIYWKLNILYRTCAWNNEKVCQEKTYSSNKVWQNISLISEYLIVLILKNKDYSLYFITFWNKRTKYLKPKVFINIYCLVSKGQSEFMMELAAIALLSTTSFC